jgi:D-alanyl-D-alanine carboxypeptidase
MRYFVLFFIAILLPVFAFLHFGKQDQVLSFMTFEKNKTAALVDVAPEPKNTAEPKESADTAKYQIPSIQYSEPLNFPSPTLIRGPYLERLQNPNFLPIRNWDVQIENVDAASALVLEPVTQKVLYHKDIFAERPIASLAKLMTALVAIEEMDLFDEILISKNAIATE